MNHIKNDSLIVSKSISENKNKLSNIKNTDYFVLIVNKCGVSYCVEVYIYILMLR